MSNNEDAVIVDAIRTPIGSLGGALAPVRPDDLAALVIRELIQRNNLDPNLVEEVYFGCANQAGEDNRNMARMAALLAGLPVEVAGVTLNRLCASGMSAVNQAARAIKVGEGEVFIAGGVEFDEPRAVFGSESRSGFLVRQSHCLGYCSWLALSESEDERKIRHRCDGRDRREHCDGTSAYYAGDAGRICGTLASTRHCRN